MSLAALYDWVCRFEGELDDLKAAFPERFLVDRNRLVMSIRCLRVSMEVMVHPRFPKRPGLPLRGAGSRDRRPRLSV